MAKLDVNNLPNTEDSETTPKGRPQRQPQGAPQAPRVLKSYDGRPVVRGERCRIDTTNAEYANNPDFIAACANAGVPATRRMASKYRRGFGSAFLNRNKVQPLAMAA